MVIPHLLIILVCGGVCFASRGAVRTNLLKCGIFAGLGVIHGLVPAITPDHLRDAGGLSLLDSRFTADARTPAAWFALASIAMLALGWTAYESWSGRRDSMQKAAYQVIHSRRGGELYIFLFWASVGLTTLGLLLQLISTGATLDEFVSAARFEYRSRDAMLSIIGGHLMSFGFIPGFVGFFLSARYRTMGIAFAVTLTLLLFFVFAKGTRSLPLGLLGGLAVAYVMRYPVTGKRLLMFGGAALLLGSLAISLYEVRKVMGGSWSEMTARAFSIETYQQSLVSDPLNYHEYLVAAVTYIPDRHPYFDGATYRRILFFWMSSSWENSWKPEDTNIIFAHVLGSEIKQDVTIPPSIPGDAYINFWGWWSLPTLFMQGMLLAWMNRKMQTSLLWFTVFGAICSRFILLVLRGQPYDLFVMLLFVLVTCYFLSWIAPYSFAQAQRDMQKMGRGVSVGRPVRGRVASKIPAARAAPLSAAGRIA